MTGFGINERKAGVSCLVIWHLHYKYQRHCPSLPVTKYVHMHIQHEAALYDKAIPILTTDQRSKAMSGTRCFAVQQQMPQLESEGEMKISLLLSLVTSY